MYVFESVFSPPAFTFSNKILLQVHRSKKKVIRRRNFTIENFLFNTAYTFSSSPGGLKPYVKYKSQEQKTHDRHNMARITISFTGVSLHGEIHAALDFYRPVKLLWFTQHAASSPPIFTPHVVSILRFALALGKGLYSLHRDPSGRLSHRMCVSPE